VFDARSERRLRRAVNFQDVYRKHFRFVRRTLARFGVRRRDLLDVAQNVFVIVHRQLAGFEGRADITTWLFSICRLVAKDYLRSGPIRREVIVDAGRIARHESSLLWRREPFDAPDGSRVLDALLQKLSDKQRKVFVLFELQEMSGEEIAGLLKIPLGTVRSRLRLARGALMREAKAVDRIAPSGTLVGEPRRDPPSLTSRSGPRVR
jgi:RNA polymerase sigma-70 factor (ECF subfamily)